jgi:hypothetical protein
MVTVVVHPDNHRLTTPIVKSWARRDPVIPDARSFDVRKNFALELLDVNLVIGFGILLRVVETRFFSNTPIEVFRSNAVEDLTNLPRRCTSRDRLLHWGNQKWLREFCVAKS